MPTIPAGIIIPWPSTAASIPAGWTRKTAWDSKFAPSAPGGSGGGGTGGSNTHTHTSPSHAPAQDPHTHSVYLDLPPESQTCPTTTPRSNTPVALHAHLDAPSSPASALNNGVAITVDANSSNDPAFLAVIWLESDGTPTGIPANALALFLSDSLPTGWTRAHADKFLKGAAAAGDGGGTGGSNTHTHTSPAHTHTQVAHVHAGGTSNTPDFSTLAKTGGTALASNVHTHTIDLDSVTAVNNPTTTIIDAADHQPPFIKANIISNGTGSASLPVGIIALWAGSVASIPSGWSRVTALDGKWVKGAAADGESGVTTGGATKHNHTASACQPTQNSHGHSATVSTSVATGTRTTGAGTAFAPAVHTHPATVTDATAVNNPATVTINDSVVGDAYPPYVEAVYIQKDAVTDTASCGLTLMGVGTA